MELLAGFPLLRQQFKALFRKNFLLAWRSRRSTFVYLFSSLVFILLLFVIQKAIEAQYSGTTEYKNVFDPKPSFISAPIPPCENKFFVAQPCLDFIWSGNDSATLSTIVQRIMDNNPGRPISSNKVKSFRTKEEVDEWFLGHPMQCPGALHFQQLNSTVISYGLQTNSTPTPRRGNYEDPTFKFQIPLQIAAEREISKHLIGDPNFNWGINFKEFAHPASTTFSSLSTAGPTFFLAIAMFGFVFQINVLVTEKELKLRQAMTMMGLYDTAYWLSWITWEGILTLFSSLLTVLFGMLFQFDFFLNNNFGVVFLLFFLFQFNMIGFAFFLATFVSKTSTSTTMGYYVFVVGTVTQIVTVFGFPYSDSYTNLYRIIWSLFPPNPYAQGLKLLSDATATPQDPGISWSGRSKCAPNDTECVITINEIYIWLIATFFLWMVLAIYFDNILPDANGVRKSILYFLDPRYWMGRGGNKVKEGGVCSCTGSTLPPESTTPDDVDVLEEENMVKQQAAEGLVDSNVAVQTRGIVKTYPGRGKTCCCFGKGSSTYHALKGLWVNFPKDQLFCLLGPNGAGKTTAINCLTGITPVTSGDALIYGHSIRSSTGMSNIRKMIGVCPQFDILWDVLSGDEHLHLFASIKGLPAPSIKTIVKKSLAEVKLTEAARMRASSYSGGMKRRLSVAIALIGEPKLIILDEPTTGMDPITRRHVWDIIENAKRGRAIILTTHSMEEADVLSDRIGIMAKGKLRCIGTSIRLKSRFGAGFVATISFSGAVNGTPAREETVSATQIETLKRFFKDRLDVVPKEESKSYLTFIIQHGKESLLSNFFAELQEREKEFGITDIQLGLTTLEEVFLNIAKKAELEAAMLEERFTSLTLNSGTIIQVPRGARFVGIPGTESAENPRGVMVEVYWEQDDSGELCISGQSSETPIPPHIQARPVERSRSRSRILGQSGPVHEHPHPTFSLQPAPTPTLSSPTLLHRRGGWGCRRRSSPPPGHPLHPSTYISRPPPLYPPPNQDLLSSPAPQRLISGHLQQKQRRRSPARSAASPTQMAVFFGSWQTRHRRQASPVQVSPAASSDPRSDLSYGGRSSGESRTLETISTAVPSLRHRHIAGNQSEPIGFSRSGRYLFSQDVTRQPRAGHAPGGPSRREQDFISTRVCASSSLRAAFLTQPLPARVPHAPAPRAAAGATVINLRNGSGRF